MKCPTQGDDVWEMNTKAHQRVVGLVQFVLNTKLIIGETGSIYPVWKVIYVLLKGAKKRRFLRCVWVVNTDGRWFTSDGEER